jgi:predicted GNAT family N-acyltransferase
VPAEVVDGALTRQLRRTILRPDFDPSEPLPGDDRPDAVHFGVTAAGGEVVSTCVLFREPYPGRADDGHTWQLRSMATAPAARGHGLGAEVLAATVHYVAVHGGGTLWCNAREPAVPLYERGGLVVEGESFSEHDIVHWRMWRPVPPVQ